jgi:hypothetical protein
MTYHLCHTNSKTGKTFCVTVGSPILEPRRIGWMAQGNSEGSGYPGIANDLSLLALVHDAASGISDKSTQDAVHIGIQSALAAIQKRGEEHGLSVREVNQSQGTSA